jgi:hypothetical protein
MCAKTRYWKAFVGADAFRLLRGGDALTEYRFGSRRIAHAFCRHCGVKLYGHGAESDFPRALYAVNISALEGLPDEVLAGLSVVFQDGRHDDWEHAPARHGHL